MTNEEASAILVQFPTIKIAVAFTEAVVLGKGGSESAIRQAIANGMTLQETLEMVRETVLEEIAEHDGSGIPLPTLRRAAEQMLLPEYATYLMGRLGMV